MERTKIHTRFFTINQHPITGAPNNENLNHKGFNFLQTYKRRVVVMNGGLRWRAVDNTGTCGVGFPERPGKADGEGWNRCRSRAGEQMEDLEKGEDICTTGSASSP